MTNKVSVIFLLTLLLIIIIGTYFFLDEKNYYKTGDIDFFKIKPGEAFTIKIHQNSSTGYDNCWINESNCKHTKTQNQSYQPRLFSNNCNGCGGTLSWTFEGLSKGIDTIKISSCPVGRMGKDCSFFSEDSIKVHHGDSIDIGGIYLPYNDLKRVDYKFMVEVE